MGLFSNAKQQTQQDPISIYSAKYTSARGSLLWISVFTFLNIIFSVIDGSRFLFSAIIPSVLLEYTRFICGMFPAEQYQEYENPQFADKSLFWIAVAVSVLVSLFFLLCYFFSKKKVGCLIAALVVFALDTVFMFLFLTTGIYLVTEIIFHAWAIISLAMGIYAHNKLQALKAAEHFATFTESDPSQAYQDTDSLQ